MTEGGMQTCPVCGVKIVPGGFSGDRVLFSSGPPGTRAMLWARVCKFAQKPGCINKNQDAIGPIRPTDYYQSDRSP